MEGDSEYRSSRSERERAGEPELGCLVHGVAYDVPQRQTLYKKDKFGEEKRITSLCPKTVLFMSENKDWPQSPDKRRVVYSDPAVALCAEEIERVDFGSLPLLREHSTQDRIGKILSGSVGPDNLLKITASVTDAEMVKNIKQSGKLEEGAFSIGYWVELDGNGSHKVVKKGLEEFSLVTRPLFENCLVDIYASADGKGAAPCEIVEGNRIKVRCGGKTDGRVTIGPDVRRTQGVDGKTESAAASSRVEKNEQVDPCENYVDIIKMSGGNIKKNEIKVNGVPPSEIMDSGGNIDNRHRERVNTTEPMEQNAPDRRNVGENENVVGRDATNNDRGNGNGNASKGKNEREPANEDQADKRYGSDKKHKSKGEGFDGMSKKQLLIALQDQEAKRLKQEAFIKAHASEIEAIQKEKEQKLKALVEDAYKMHVEDKELESSDDVKEAMDKFLPIANLLAAAGNSGGQHDGLISYFSNAVENNKKKTNEINQLRAQLEQSKRGDVHTGRSDDGASRENAKMEMDDNFKGRGDRGAPRGAAFGRGGDDVGDRYDHRQGQASANVRPGFDFTSGPFGTFGMASNDSLETLLVNASDKYVRRGKTENYNKRKKITSRDDDDDDDSYRNFRQGQAKKQKYSGLSTGNVTSNDFVFLSAALSRLLESNPTESGSPMYVKCSENSKVVGAIGHLSVPTHYHPPISQSNHAWFDSFKYFDDYPTGPQLPHAKPIGGAYYMRQTANVDSNTMEVRASEKPYTSTDSKIGNERLELLKKVQKIPYYETSGTSLEVLCVMDEMCRKLSDFGVVGVKT